MDKGMSDNITTIMVMMVNYGHSIAEIAQRLKIDSLQVYQTVSKDSRTEKDKLPCEICGRIAPKKQYVETRGKRGQTVSFLVCSNCRKEIDKINRDYKPYHVSEETKEKLRKIATGRRATEKARRKMSEAHLREKNWNWQNGKSFEPYGPEFNKKLKLKIRRRDNFTCQECGYTEKQLGYILSVHHIDYDKKNNKEENLISLCKNCHGQTNFNREDWIDYFNNKMN